ncbi:MAG: YraN family protein, partial [Planctomycetota bacterium]|nr:YraN family protein [Planctomycetota bacterium]
MMIGEKEPAEAAKPRKGWRRALERGLRGMLIARAPRTFLRCCEADRDELGLVGEELAARHLLHAGWRLLGRRVATPAGEVDLWAVRAGVCAAVEVKAGRLARLPAPRPAPAGDQPTAAGGPAARVRPGAGLWDLRWRPGLRVDRARTERLWRCARFLAACTPSAAGRPAPRVRLVEVLVGRGGRLVEVREEVLRP